MLSVDGIASNDVFLVCEKINAKPTIRIALESAERYKADAVYFRFSESNQKSTPIPLLYIYDRTEREFSPSEFGDIQRRLWNVGVVPLAAVITISSIKLFSCRCKPDYDESGHGFVYKPFEILEKILETEKLFLKHSIVSGVLWEDPRFSAEFSFKHSAHQTLLTHLKYFKKKIVARNQIPEAITKRILVLAILLKYLTDRRDDDGNGVFPVGFFKAFTESNADSLSSLFREKGVAVALFDYLSNHFSGKIFNLTPKEKQVVETADLSFIACFLDGTEEPTGSRSFWPLYSFDDLPVELISNIYEEFLVDDKKNKNGIVYTPPILVEFLLDRCLPLSPDSIEKKILDPACGSGIFLVSAFSRLVQSWRMAHDWEHPNHEELKRILRENIFGVDKEREAVLVTAFSLCVALCDKLQPKTIWEELRFDDLCEQNILSKDFFETVNDVTFAEQYDVVVGNPPFVSKLTTPHAKAVENDAIKVRPTLPDNNLALLFLEQSFKVCRPGGCVCLIQPAGPLIYNLRGLAFREYLWTNYDIHTVYDFTPLKSILFKSDVAAVAIMAINAKPVREDVRHLIFRRTFSSKARLILETDYYDIHWLKREYIKRNSHVWKTNLLGGGRLHQLVERFSGMTTFQDFLSANKDEGWSYGEGYNVGSCNVLNKLNNRQELLEMTEVDIKERYNLKFTPKRSSNLTGHIKVPPDAIAHNSIDNSKLSLLDDVYFEATRDRNNSIFQPPHILMRETVSQKHIPIAFSNTNLVFSKQIFGVHAPPSQVSKLKEIVSRLSKTDLYAALIALMSSRYLVNKATSILTSDIKKLPYPEESELTLTWWEQHLIEDVVETQIEFISRGERSSAVEKASKDDLSMFGKTYCRVLNMVYKHFHSLEPILFHSIVCYPFCFGEVDNIEILTPENAEETLNALCGKQSGPRLFVNRIIRLYNKKMIFMIKPNQKRFWLKSIALRDADETLAELFKAGF